MTRSVRLLDLTPELAPNLADECFLDLGAAADFSFVSFIVAESALKNVDISPLIPIIENAGGVVTTWDGGPAEEGGNCVAAATPELHEAALRVLNG